MRMGKKVARVGISLVIVCTAFMLAIGIPSSSIKAQSNSVAIKSQPPSCVALGDNLISNQFIESAAVVGLAGTALTLFSKPETQRSLAADCILK